MTVDTSVTPLSKANVASTMGVSPRTIENWVATGEMPAPFCIGGRVYWHSERFNAWLNERLSAPASASPNPARQRQLPRQQSASNRARTQLSLQAQRRLAAIEAPAKA